MSLTPYMSWCRVNVHQCDIEKTFSLCTYRYMCCSAVLLIKKNMCLGFFNCYIYIYIYIYIYYEKLGIEFVVFFIAPKLNLTVQYKPSRVKNYIFFILQC
jgi:hypothetical protein